jgi:hypothetical protein
MLLEQNTSQRRTRRISLFLVIWVGRSPARLGRGFQVKHFSDCFIDRDMVSWAISPVQMKTTDCELGISKRLRQVLQASMSSIRTM